MVSSSPSFGSLLREGTLESLTSSETLEEFAHNLYGLIHALHPDAVTSMLRVDRDGLIHPVGTSGLPAAYDAAIDGLAIGEGAGACGTAAFRKEPVLAHDRPDDLLWPVLRECGLPEEFGTCWSTPIVTAAGEVVGTFAFYYRGEATPSATDRAVVETCTDLCRLALEHDRLVRETLLHRTRDAVTGIPFYDSLETGANGTDDGDRAVLAVEVDHHGAIALGLTFEQADRLLADVAARLQELTRETGARIRRLREPRFLLFLPIEDRRALGRLAQRITELGWARAADQATGIDSAVTVGVAVAEGPVEDVHELVRGALMALSQAASMRPGTVLFFDAAIGRQLGERHALGPSLRAAIDAGTISLAFQPQVSLVDGTLVGVEVLARWQGPDGGGVSPARFVRVAEEIGLSRELDRLVFEKACAQLTAWDAAGIHLPRVSVNLSPVTLTSPIIVPVTAAILGDYGIDPGRMTIEVIESRLVEESTAARALHGLHELGLRLSMDDFGTGYSAFAQLATLPIDEVKIDRSFISDGIGDGTSGAVAKAIIQVAQAFGQEVVAEGIETVGQRDMLREHGCPVGQGYLFSHPLAADDFAAWYAGRAV